MATRGGGGKPERVGSLVDGLLERGYSEDEIAKILSGNVMRVWKQAENYAEGR